MPIFEQTQIDREEYQPFLDQEQEGADVEDYEKRYKRRSSRKILKLSRTHFIVAATVTLCFIAGLTVGIVCIAKEERLTELPKTVVAVFKKAAVAADSTQCSEVGKDILSQGGNAVDAAIAALLCSGLTSAQSMGIGGGFFMTIYNRTSGLSTVIDARETAPENATMDMFGGNRSASASGHLSIAVPGEIKGYWLAHQKYGQLPWHTIFEPAIKMASEGFPVPIALSNAIISAQNILLSEPSLKVTFINPVTNKLYTKGENMTRPQLASTMRVISKEGAKAFYNGSLTDLIMEDLKDIGSIITRDDLLKYEAIEKTPLEIVLSGGVKMVSPPPPGSGAVLSFILNILDGYNFTAKDLETDASSTLTYHRVIEAFKFAYAKRTDLGDEDFVNVTELVQNLTSRAYAESIRKLITDNTTHGYEYYGPTYYDSFTTGTSHMSVIDQNGNAVSVTSTINSRFGSKRRGMKTGIIFNNEMDDFSSPNITNSYGLQPSPANFIIPGKRPLSSMCPAVLINSNGNVSKILGAAGGSKITTATAWVAAHVLWLGLDIQTAIDYPRLHHQLLPPWIDYEKGFKESQVEALHKLGHNVTEYPVGQSIVQGIDIHDGFIYAVSDYRKGGTPDGY